MARPNPPIFVIQCVDCNADLPGSFGLPESVTALIYACMCPVCTVPVILYKSAHDRLLTIWEQMQMEKAVIEIAKIQYPNCQWWIDRAMCDAGKDCKHSRWHIRPA